LLCERLLAVELPPTLSAELRRTATAPLLEALALDAMLGEGEADVELTDRAFGHLRVVLSSLLIGEGGSYLWREITRYSVSAQDVATFPLPPRLTWLYVVLRAPLWALRRLKLARN
jgi:hypothetical protein